MSNYSFSSTNVIPLMKDILINSSHVNIVGNIIRIWTWTHSSAPINSFFSQLKRCSAN